MKKSLTLFIVCCAGLLSCLAQQKITGKVLYVNGNPLSGASIKLQGSNVAATTDSAGIFTIAVSGNQARLNVTYIGYLAQEVLVTLPVTRPLTITLEPANRQLNEIVVSTGYQQLPAERATGSFVQVDQALFNRSVSTSLLSRLQDVVPGLVFNRYRGAKSEISIRGSSTIFSNAAPLIVLDNFPYEGEILNINPNDVESVTVLKDAAAASIWGSRAGNGVIVITTKKGGYNRAPKISFSSNFTLTEKQDPFYSDQMNNGDFIDVEKLLFSRGYYTANENSTARIALSPVVELLIAKRDGKLPANEADRQIEALKNHDTRSDIAKYVYRNEFRQQYALNISGGGELQRYYISGGYDKNHETAIGNEYARVTLNATNTYSLANKKLELTAGIYYTMGIANNNAASTTSFLNSSNPYPYLKLADENGNALAITRSYRNTLLTQAQQQGLLNWEYKPLDELRASDDTDQTTDYRVNLSLKYKLPLGFSVDGLYQYGRTSVDLRNLESMDLWSTRNEINRFTIVNADGSLTRPIPLGGILDLGNTSSITHTARGQLNYTFTSEQHEVTAIAGTEIRDNSGSGRSSTTYGYDDEHATGTVVDYITSFKLYTSTTSTAKIPFTESFKQTSDRFLSWFGNAGYTYRKKYTVTGSARLDRSNIFGVNTNQKGVPLWSAGASWNLSDEDFYQAAWLPSLRLRVTYGYSGNVNRSLSAYTTVRYNNGASTLTRIPYATLNTPPNPELRWERVKILNAAVDFASRNRVISGSVEVYHKQGFDLIGDTPFPPSSGITTFRGNVANTSGKGVDVNLVSRIPIGSVNCQTNFFASFIREKLTKYLVTSSASSYVQNGEGISLSSLPREGKPLNAVYSYPWGGLDPATGDPMGYLNGVLSKEYAKIISSATLDDIIYHGPVNPVLFGAFRNTFSYKNLSASANISYRFGYFFRQPAVNYTSALSAQGTKGDYPLRWQKPGDEAFTTVPSMPAVNVSGRDTYYVQSNIHVEKGDHIRLQDVRLSYDLPKLQLKKFALSGGQFFIYASNLGILWKATKSDYDPDYISLTPPTRNIAAGFKADF